MTRRSLLENIDIETDIKIKIKKTRNLELLKNLVEKILEDINSFAKDNILVCDIQFEHAN